MKLMESMKYVKIYTVCLLKQLPSSNQINVLLFKYVSEDMLICNMFNDKKTKQLVNTFHQLLCDSLKCIISSRRKMYPERDVHRWSQVMMDKALCSAQVPAATSLSMTSQ